MQNKVIQSSNSKIKKEVINPKKEIANINPLQTNQKEMIKHKSQEFNQNSPKNTSNTSNLTSSNNSNKNTILSNNIKQTVNSSGIKNKITKKTCISNTHLNEIKKYDDEQNIDEEKTFGSIENIIYFNDDKKNKKNSKEENNKNIKKKIVKDLKSDRNIKSHIKNPIENILYESDSCNENDSLDENSQSKEDKLRSINSNINMKINNIKNLKLDIDNNNGNNLNKNTKKRNTVKLSKFQEMKINIDNKEKKEKKKSNLNKNQKEINKNKNNQDEIYDELIVKANEFDNTIKDKQINTSKNKEFPQLFINPFMTKTKPIDTIDLEFKSKKSISNQNICQILKTDENKEKTKNNHHIKTSTFGTNNKSSTTNNNLSKNDNNNINLSDNKYLLLLAKKGDGEKLIEFCNKINSLSNKLDLNYKDEKGFTALHYSCDDGNLKVVEILLNAKCDPNVKNNEKETPLHFASKKGYFDICKKLVENGAIINIYNSENNSPFHYACTYNYVEIIEYFLTKSPNIEVKNIYGKSPIDLTTNKEIKLLINKYLIKNRKKGIITSDTQLIDLSEKYKEEKNKMLNRNTKSPIINNNNNLEINNKNILENNNFSLSPLCKSPENKLRIKKNDFNSIPESFEIKRKNTLPKNFLQKNTYTLNLENNDSKDLNSSNIKNNQQKNIYKTNTNLVIKKNELKNTKKIKEKEGKNNIIINNNDKNRSEKNVNKQYQNISYSNINNNSCLLNRLKKTQTADIFSPSLGNDNDDKINKTNIYNSINKGQVNLNDSKINNSIINESSSHSHYRINLSANRRNENKRSKSKNKSVNREIESSKALGNNNYQNKSKFYQSNLKKKRLLLDSVEFSNLNLIQLNKTDEDIKKSIPKMGKKNFKKQNTINSKNRTENLKLFDTTDKIITKSNFKNMKKKTNQSKKEKKIDNSLISNCNISKISCGQNRNNNKLDKINKTNIIDKTLTDNIHNKLNLNSIEEEKLTPSNFLCLAQLGKGSFGEVYLVQKKNSKKKYAMKVLRKERVIGQNLLKYAIAERNVLSLSHHPFIVKLNYAFQTSTKLFLVLEYCPNGDLAKHLLFEKRFSEQRAKFYLCEILLAMEDLHKRDIIFRDLKPDNVVLDEQGHCKLTDFGLSKEGVADNAYAQSFCGSIAYLAPEMLKKKGHGKAVDWYLLGVLFYEMLVGITPFFTTRKEEIFHNIEYGELNIPDYISTEAAGLLRELLEKNPNKRLGSIKDAQEIKEHPYFKDVDWDKVYNKKIKPPIFMNYMSKMIHFYHIPRMFANEDLLDNDNDKPNPNTLKNWSFINNEECDK